ncbi:MAG: hypothetical protein WCP85_29180 [Mariniphaga sp.]
MKDYLIELPELIENELIVKQTTSKMKGITLIRLDIETPVAGYGKCRSCDCKGYISKHNGSHECRNCNHHFDRHWD